MKITINLSDRAPVSIETDEWPIVAKAKDHDNEYLSQANRIWEICVREKDGRRIVYGWKKEGNGGMPIGEKEIFAGEVTDCPSTIQAIRRVASDIGNIDITSYVIRDLPAEDL